MNNYLKYLILMVTILSLNLRCQKDSIVEYYPRVRTSFTTMQNDGTLIVTGQVEHHGKGKSLTAGVCINDSVIPTLLDLTEQIGISPELGNDFEVEFRGLELNKRYYIRSFVINEYGYTYGNTIRTGFLKRPLDPDCQPEINTIATTLGGTAYNIDSISTYSDTTWRLNTKANGMNYTFTFNKAPEAGIYFTSKKITYETHVIIQIRKEFNTFYAEQHTRMYIKEVGNNLYEATICDALYYDQFKDKFYLTARFRFSL